MAYNELKRVLDQVKPSREQEAAMLNRLLTDERTEHRMKKRTHTPRLAAAAAAVALVLTSGAFAAVTGLDRRLLDYFGGDGAQEELLSATAMVVDKELTDEGATLHVRQVVADRYSVMVLMDFTAPEGVALTEDYYVLGGGVKATAPDGRKMSSWGSGFALLADEAPEDNRITLLFTVHTLDDSFNLLGARLSLDFEGLYDDNMEKNLLAAGRWRCNVTLPTEDPGRYVTPDAPMEVGGSRVTLTSLYISPISFAWELGEGEDDLQSMDTAALHGRGDWPEQVFLTTRGGETIPVGERNFLLTQYKTDVREQDHGRYCFRLDSIIDPAEVAAVTLFGQTVSLG